MKKCLAIFVCISFFLTVGFKLFNNSDYQPKSEQAVGVILEKTASALKKRYKMNPIATNVSMPGGVLKLLGLDFQICGPLTKEKIRKILMDSAQELLANINGDLKVRSFLEIYPFTIKNVEINLFIVDANRKEIDHPHIGIAGISRGELDYLTLQYTDIPNKITESKESYEDALNIINRKDM